MAHDQALPSQPFPFAVLFAATWIGLSLMLGIVSGWFRLMQCYPDRTDRPLRVLRFISGQMGLVSMRMCLRLEPCETGLRIAIPRLFRPFLRPLFVPWEDIALEENKVLFVRLVKMRFASGGGLMVSFSLAAQLAQLVPQRWPQSDVSFPASSDAIFKKELAILWLFQTIVMLALFAFISRRAESFGEGVPIGFMLIAPAVLSCFTTVIRWLGRR